ncbi:uncharacterized protein LOC144560373 isoform X2 [Carex rostrata]
MEKGEKGYAGKGKTPFKVVASKRSSSGREKEPVNASPVEIDSDSDSEGFIEEIDFSKSNGKLSSKGTSGKDGKGFSSGKAVGKGGIYSSSKKPPKRDTDVKLQLETPSGARVVMDCEAADILQQIQEQMVILSEDPTIKFPLSFDKAYQYTKEGKQYSDTKSVKDVLEYPCPCHDSLFLFYWKSIKFTYIVCKVSKFPYILTSFLIKEFSLSLLLVEMKSQEVV